MEELKPHFEAKSTEHGIALNKSFKIAAANFPMESFAGISALAVGTRTISSQRQCGPPAAAPDPLGQRRPVSGPSASRPKRPAGNNWRHEREAKEQKQKLSQQGKKQKPNS
jgi:hypothetical protein